MPKCCCCGKELVKGKSDDLWRCECTAVYSRTFAPNEILTLIASPLSVFAKKVGGDVVSIDFTYLRQPLNRYTFKALGLAFVEPKHREVPY